MENDTLRFENHLVYDRSCLMQINRRSMFRSRTELYLWLGALIGMLALTLIPGAAAGRPLLNDSNRFSFIIVLVLGALFLALYFGLPALYASTQLKRQQANGMGDYEIWLRFYDDRVDIRNSATHEEGHFDYASIKKCMESEDYYLMQDSARRLLVVRKAGFTKGSPADFQRFMAQKASGAKIQWKAA